MSEEHHEQLYYTLRKLIPPPNPIIDKQVPIDLPLQPPPPTLPADDANSDEEEEGREGPDSLAAMYSNRTPLFDKWPARQNSRNGITYFSSAFLERTGRDPLQALGPEVSQKEGVTFSSSYEGGNLLAAYQVGEAEFDLLLQNDTNSGGYTQWFDFTLSNSTQRGTLKLNIVNLYKRRSLFGQGLKPLTRSHVYEKGWRRGCHGVEYYPAEMRMEGRRAKKYRLLSFKYDFTREGDTVQFCYCLPYSHSDLTAFLSSLDSPHARVKYLGATPLGRILPLLRVSEEGEGAPRRGVVLMGRQHPGETPSSHILQALAEELLLPSLENEFLLSRYNFHLFPMVNIDGVVLGNYRCNFYGVDLNRCWQFEEAKRNPEIGLVKTELRRIMKREEIELVVDLHGHSNRMNSFFYANSFGRHNLIFPAVAAKTAPFIELAECSLADEDSERASTARVALGNMVRETGSAYTYEVSLFGSAKNGKKIAFGIEQYQEIARGLLAALYKMGVELQKEERLQKESAYLKEVRKDIRRFEGREGSRNDVGSDEEAKKTSMIEERIRVSPEKNPKKPSTEREGRRRDYWEIPTKEQSTQTQCEFEIGEYRPVRLEEKPEKAREKKLLDEPKKKLSFSIRRMAAEQSTRKQELMSKLRVFGETFVPEPCLPDLSHLAASLSASAQTDLTLRRHRAPLERPSNRSAYIAANFLGRRLGEPSIRRRERIHKSQSTRATQAEGGLGEIFLHNKLSLY